MEELIKTFHIDYRLMLGQLVNFAIVLGMLYFFAYAPILKILNERTKKIEKGIEDAQDAKKKLEEVSEKEKEVLLTAKKEAQEIIKKSEEEAKKNAEAIARETKEKTDKMLSDNKKQLEQEREKMMGEMKAEIADLVIAATGKIIEEKLDKNKDRELIENAIR